MSTTILFSETQAVPRGLRIASIIISSITIIGGLLIYFVMNSYEPLMSLTEQIVFFAVVIGVPVGLLLWFNTVKQTIEITDEAIIVKQHGVHFKAKVIPRADVVRTSVRKLDAFGEFGGWGIRYAFNNKWGYVWNGDHALDVTMNNGRRYVISVVDHIGISRLN